MDIQLRATSHDNAIMILAKYYNKKAGYIYRLPDSDQYVCKECEELEPVSKDVDYLKPIKKILDTKKFTCN